MNFKLVSVIIPVYNVEAYIEKCIMSIVSQTYKNLEIIFVNDGSEQEEESIIKQYMERDSRIHYIKKNANEGLFRARVTGVKASHGDYIQFVDSDDYINEDFIRLLVRKAEEEDSDITFARTVTCTPRGSESIYVFQNMELYQLPLEGLELKKAYYGQHGFAYIFHTIWNKLYKRELWMQALPYFEKLGTPIVMTEDIAFSSILFYFAHKASCTENAVYFYCKHTDASTDSKVITLNQYKKRIGNVCTVFDFLQDFFSDKEKWIQDCMADFRRYYGRMWHRIAEEMDEAERSQALVLCKRLADVELDDKSSAMDDNYFCYMEIPYSKCLDEIKKRIYEGSESVISFDVFDTVVARPFFHPTDLFAFLDKKFEEIYSSNISFQTIRTEGEEGCRKQLCDEKREDVTLEEIYQYISEMYDIPWEKAHKLMEYEEALEIEFNFRRNTGYELYSLALDAGKKVIFTSDMYLPKSCIAKILHKNGYTRYEAVYVSSEYKKLKYTSSLYRAVLSEMHVKPEDILHIGDNQDADVNGAEKIGISTVYIPKSMDAFCGNTKKITNHHRFTMGKDIGGSYRGMKSFEKNIAYGATIALASIKYFDNSYCGFNDFTDFNVDGYFAGYYLLGTSLLGQIAWLENIVNEKGIKRIIFTSRDGYLLMEAYRRYLKICKKEKEVLYFYVSRRSMMPWILKDKLDFMSLPIVYQKYSPDSVEELLSFCISHESDEEWEDVLNTNDIIRTREFASIVEYHKFMNLFLAYRYSSSEHMKAKKTVSQYCSVIHNDDGIYDLGYSASIHKAICDASGRKPTALFMHSDAEKHLKNERIGGFEIVSMMDTIPNANGLLREFFFSDTGGSCIGYEQNGQTTPIIENEDKNYSDLFPIRMMQMGALKMVDDFYHIFKDYLPYMEIRTEEMLLPFESFLAFPAVIDTKMFAASYFEDKVYGKISQINVRDFWMQLLINQPGYQKNDIIHYFDELLKKYHKKKLAFFGTGKMCEAMFETNPDIPVEIYLDNDIRKTGQKYRGRKIYLPKDYPNLKELYIVVVIAFYKEVEEQLRDMGLVKYEDYLNYLELF